jgi:hypothetical protein
MKQLIQDYKIIYQYKLRLYSFNRMTEVFSEGQGIIAALVKAECPGHDWKHLEYIFQFGFLILTGALTDLCTQRV